MYNEQLHPLFRHIINGIHKHIFKPSDTDKDFCAHCGRNFRDTTIHLTSMEYDENHGMIPSNTPVQIIKESTLKNNDDEKR
jgi:hypothetical protein